MKKNLVISTVAAIAAINPEFQFHKGAIRTEGPDPLPYRDDEGNIVTLTQEEENRWNAYQKRKQGSFAASQNAQNGNTAAATVSGIDKSDLPF